MRRVWVAVAAYVLVLGACAAWRWHVWTFGTDTGTFAQVIADAFGGFRDGPEQGTHFRFHWAPLLATLWPVVVLTRSPLSLQFAQIVLVAASAVPLYAIARGYLDERRAFGCAALLLLYPPLAAVAFTEFHEIAFYPLVALALVWAAERARWRAFAALALASALIREEACIVFAVAGFAFTGLALACLHKDGEAGMLAGEPREPARLALAGLGLACVNAVALAFYFGGVIPHVGPWQPSRFYDYPFAHGPLAVTLALLTHPANLAYIADRGRLTYTLEAFVPLAFLPLRSWWTLLALPGLFGLLLASDQIAWRMGSHYAAIWCPWLLLAAVAALVSLSRGGAARAALRWNRVALALCAVFLIAFNPAHPAHYLKPVYGDLADAKRALALAPPDAHVATHDEWFTKIALRNHDATVFYCPYVDFAVYADDWPNDFFQREILPQIARELASGQTRVVARFGRVAAYARRPDAGARVGDCITPGDVRYKPPY